MDRGIEVINENDIKTYSLYELRTALNTISEGDFIYIKGQMYAWELYSSNNNCFHVRNTISKQMIIILKD